MCRRMIFLTLASALALLVAACGDDGGHDAHSADGSDPGTEPRVVRIEMVDIAFTPTAVDVEAGETVRFEFINSGALAHDAFVGDELAQEQHEVEMRESSEDRSGGTDHGAHESGDAITVDPGDRGELEHTFAEPGTYFVGCHQPGHYAAGMTIEVTVS
jgi:uncharacterized cupredoxin-like copper-binding protein